MRRLVAFLILTGLVAIGCTDAAGPPTAPPAASTAQPPSGDAAPISDWAGLAPLRPQAVETAGFGPRLDVTPDGRQVAYCADEGIRVTADGGVTWRTVSTGPVAGLADGMGYVPFRGSRSEQPLCSGVLLDRDHPDSLYAAFSSGKKHYGAPPVYRLGFYTTDGGGSWQLAPAPAGVPADTFAGFRREGARVIALFHTPKLPGANRRVQVTADGGATWEAGNFGCLTGGICLTFGPLPISTGSCAMHEYKQPLLASADSGSTWTESTALDGINACFPAELVATGPLQALLVAEWGHSPVTLTLDGGKSWTSVTLPPLPGGAHGVRHLGLKLLPDGSLLQRADGGQGSTWQLLRPGADQWCALPAGLIPVEAVEPHIGGDHLWWATLDGASAGAAAGKVELASLRCSN